MKKFLLATAALVSLASQQSLAADLPAKVPYVAPIWSWTGFYFGGHVGGAWVRKDWQADPTGFFTPIVGPNGFPARSDIGGSTYGIQFGYNYQVGQWVWGVEVDWAFADVQGNTRCANAQLLCETKVKSLGDATVRLGYTVDHLLLYVKGGVAWAREEYQGSGQNLGANIDIQARDGRWGGTVGAGLEFAFNAAWSAKVEYDYIGFGSRTVGFTNFGTLFNGAAVPLEIKQQVHIVKAGVNYRFDWLSPVVAKY